MFSNREMTNKLKATNRGAYHCHAVYVRCSALPFIEGTVEIGGVTYCEGALVDTVNFESLLEEHRKI